MVAADGAARESCPIWGLDDFVLGHWDVVELCRRFACAKCVSDCGEGPDEPPAPIVGDGGPELPF